MAFSDAQIANAVAYFTTKNTARAAIILNPSMGFNPGAQAAAVGAKKPTISGIIRDVVGYYPGAGLIADALEPMDEAETPTNATQWILNLLSTGGYASARFTEGLGAGVARASTDEELDRLDSDPLGYYAGNLGNTIAQSFGGAARGVAEGFGARFDGVRPRTYQQNFEDIGLNDNIRGGIAAIGGDEGWQNFGVGAAGFIGDVAFDPLTYVAGTGLLKGLRGAGSALGDSLRAGNGVASSILDAGRAGALATRTARADLAAARVAAREARADRRAFNRGEQATSVLDNIGSAPMRAAGDVARAGELPGHPGTALELDLSPSGRMSSIDALLPALRGAREMSVPADQILSDASRALSMSEIPAATGRALVEAARGGRVVDVQAAVKAARADPATRTWLNKTQIRDDFTGSTVSLAQAVERVASLRASGAPAGRVDALMAKIDAAITAGTNAPRQITPPSLLDAVSKSMPGWETQVPGATPTMDLLERFAGAKSMAERKQALQDVLGTSRFGFKSFDDAMLSALDGEVDAELMREMLKSLGIRSQISDPDALRKALAGQGVYNWAAIKAGLRTPEEVFTDHGIPREVAAAAAKINLDEAIDAAKGDYARSINDFGYDPALIKPPLMNADGTPRAGAGVGEAVHVAVERMGGLLKGVQRGEAYGSRMLREIHTSILKTLRLRGRNVTGGARGENFADDYLRATLTTEKYARSLGIVPRLNAGARAEPIYVSFGQVAQMLPRDVLEKAMFRPMRYRLGDTVADPAYKAGLSIYPTTIADGARVALRGGDEAAVREALERAGSHNKFQGSAEGQAALDDLARAMTSPGFLQPLHALHEAQSAVAARIALATADGLVEPLGARVVHAVSLGGDRSYVTAAMRAAYESVQKATKGLDAQPTLAHDLATARLDNAMVNGVLGEIGTPLARMDARAVSNVKAQGAKPKPSTVRADGVRNMRTVGDELAPVAMRQLDDEAAAFRLEDVDRAIIPTMTEMDQGLGLFGVFGKVWRGIEGTAGQADLKTLQVRATSGLHDYAQEFRSTLSGWLRGTRKNPGMQQRLAEDLGVKAGSLTDDALNSHMADWWRNLAVITSRHPNLPENDLLDALTRGLPMDPKSGIPAAAIPLSRAQAEMAVELHRLINQVFAPKGGPFARIGMTADDLIEHLDRYGFSDGRPFGGYKPKPGALAGQEGIWRTWIDVEQPLDLLSSYMKGMSAAATRPSITASMSALFSHTALGMTAKEAAAAGFKRIDTTRGALAKFVDPDDYYHPEMIKQMAYLQNAVDMLDKELPKVMRLVVGPFDAVTGVWKSSTTIWNPAHHVTNVMGEFLMLAMAGVPPMHALRAVRLMARLQKQFGNLSPIDKFDALFNAEQGVAGAKGTMAPRFLDDTAQVSIKGQGIVPLGPEAFWQAARGNGVAITARESKDMLPGQAEDIMSGRWGAWKRNPMNPVGAVAGMDRKLGQFSAVRDNTTRLAHFYAALESKQFNSMEEAINYASAQVHSYHPTIQTLSAFDQKYTRRLIAFHTWVRQAAGRILATAIERPGMVTIPSKWQYNMAEAHGLEPESFGKPIPNDPRIASYMQQGVYGPSWLGGYSPFGGTGDLEEGEEPHLWGMSMNAPQLDALYTLFGGVNFGEDPIRGSLWKLAGMANPLLKMPAEYVTDQKFGIDSQTPISDDYGQWLLNQTGAPGRIANAFGILGTTQENWTPEQIKGDTQRKLVNWLLGLKVTDYTNPTSATIAGLEQADWEKQTLRNLGYSDDEIKDIRAYWEDYRASNP